MPRKKPRMSDEEEELQQALEQSTLLGAAPAREADDANSDAAEKPKTGSEGSSKVAGRKPAEPAPDSLVPSSADGNEPFDATEGLADAIQDVALSNQDIQDILDAVGTNDEVDKSKDSDDDSFELW